MKKKALLSSILTIALCLSLIAGSTFALFTSESKVNVAVTAGKVNVVATIENLELYSPTSISENGNIVDATNAADTTFKNGGTASLVDNKLTLTNITPGDKVTFDVKITNNSNVTVQYRSIVEKISDTGLWAGLKVSINSTEYNGETKKSDWTVLNVGSEVITVPVVIELPTTAGNEYQEKSCELAYTVEAVQGNADMPDEWDGVTKTAPQKDDEGVYHITNAAEMVYAMEHSTPVMIGYGSNEYAFGKYVLDKDVDFGGATIPGFANNGSNNFQGSFDGQEHTISNFVIDSYSQTYYAGLFGYLYGATVQNVNISGATVIGQKQVGVLVGCASDNSVVTNCNVYDSTVIATKKVGVIAGYTLNSTITNCYAENCVVYCEENDASECGKIIGYENNGTAATDNTEENVIVNMGVSYVANGVMQQGRTYLISNAKGLQWFANQVNENYNGFNGYTVKLTADIDLKNAEWYPIGQGENINGKMQEFFGIFDGDGHTIKNLKIKSHTPEEIRNSTNYINDDSIAYGVGFFGWLSGAVKNVTFENVKVSGHNKVGVVAGYFQYTGSSDVIENCIVKDCEVVDTHVDNTFCGDKAGGIVGMIGATNGAVKNCQVENTIIIAGRDAGQVVGCAQSGTIVENCTATSVTVTAGGDCTGVNINNDIVGRDLR